MGGTFLVRFSVSGLSAGFYRGIQDINGTVYAFQGNVTDSVATISSVPYPLNSL